MTVAELILLLKVWGEEARLPWEAVLPTLSGLPGDVEISLDTFAKHHDLRSEFTAAFKKRGAD